MLQPKDWWRVVIHGSTAKGYRISASSEAKFDNANSRYTVPVVCARANQACTSGPVVESRK